MLVIWTIKNLCAPLTQQNKNFVALKAGFIYNYHTNDYWGDYYEKIQ